jgi:hypothetical protein
MVAANQLGVNRRITPLAKRLSGRMDAMRIGSTRGKISLMAGLRERTFPQSNRHIQRMISVHLFDFIDQTGWGPPSTVIARLDRAIQATLRDRQWGLSPGPSFGRPSDDGFRVGLS